MTARQKQTLRLLVRKHGRANVQYVVLMWAMFAACAEYWERHGVVPHQVACRIAAANKSAKSSQKNGQTP